MAAFLENYTLLDQIGKGGFAQVCKVRHNKYRYIRAIKILDQAILKGENDENWIKFRNECETLLNIGNGNHPNIIHIYQPVLSGMQAFVEMDFIDGQDISHILKGNPFVEADDVIHLAKDISSALAYCHHDIYKFCMDKVEDNLEDDPEDGSKALLDDDTIKRLVKKYHVTHNDIHSGNIMRRESGSYVLLDFGLSLQDGEVLKTSKHKNGAIEYKAPEKWADTRDANTITPATDIYSFGVVMYEYLTGQVPFPCDTTLPEHIAAHHLGEAHKYAMPPSVFEARKRCFEKTHPGESFPSPDYPQWLEEAIMRCLQKDPKMRFRDGKELHDFIIGNIAESLKAEKSPVTDNEIVPHLKEKIQRLTQEKSSLADDLKKSIRLWKYISVISTLLFLGLALLTYGYSTKCENEIDRLQVELSHYKRKVEPENPDKPDQSAEIDLLKQENSQLKQAISSKDATIAAKEKENSQLKQTISSKNAAIAAKDREIQVLNKVINK